MELTPSELASHIQKLNCLYVEYTDKMISHMEIGHCDFECMYNKAWLIKSYINILNRFYADGQDCVDCDIVGNTYLVPTICGYDTSYLIDGVIAQTYTCYYVRGESVLDVIGAYFTYNDGGTVTITRADGTTTTVAYAFDSETQVLVITLASTVLTFNLVFSNGCSDFISSIHLTGQPSPAFFTIPIGVEIGQIFFVGGVQINNAFVPPFGSTWQELYDLFSTALSVYGAGFTLGEFPGNGIPFTLVAPTGTTVYNGAAVTVDDGVNPIEFIGYFNDNGSVSSGELLLELYSELSASGGTQTGACTWKENCHTTEVIDKVVKHAYTLMDVNCNCN